MVRLRAFGAPLTMTKLRSYARRDKRRTHRDKSRAFAQGDKASLGHVGKFDPMLVGS